MEAIKAGLGQNKLRRLHEVADGMLKVYRTLVRMQYLEDSWIDEGPHEVDALTPAWRKAGFADSIMEVNFVFGSIFTDFRYGGGFEGVRNPMCADDEEEFLRPWMTTLSSIGNDKPALLYDARRHIIGIYRQADSGSWDPNCGMDNNEEIYPSDDEGSDSNDDDLYDYNMWDEMNGRLAPNVLRDIVLWYENLTQLPGEGELSYGGWAPALIKPLYIKHGWPHNFNATDFLVDQVKSSAVESVDYDVKADLLARINRTMTEDDNIEDLWEERWTRFREGRSRIDVPILLQEAERAYERPDDRQLRLLKNLRHGIRSWEKKRSGADDKAMMGDTPESVQIRRAYAEKYLEVQKRAYEACKAELGGDAFFAERNMVEADIDPDESPNPELQERSRLHIEAIRGWLVQVPEEAHRAREMAEIFIKGHEAKL